MKPVMKNLALLFLFSSMICLSGCSGSESSENNAAPQPPESSEEELGEASGSPEDMFLDDSESEGSSLTE